jgi:hypothetical protein
MAMVEPLDGLFEADRDQQADDEGGDVDEEVAPGVGRVGRRVDVEQGSLLWKQIVRTICLCLE